MQTLSLAKRLNRKFLIIANKRILVEETMKLFRNPVALYDDIFPVIKRVHQIAYNSTDVFVAHKSQRCTER